MSGDRNGRLPCADALDGFLIPDIDDTPMDAPKNPEPPGPRPSDEAAADSPLLEFVEMQLDGAATEDILLDFEDRAYFCPSARWDDDLVRLAMLDSYRVRLVLEKDPHLVYPRLEDLWSIAGRDRQLNRNRPGLAVMKAKLLPENTSQDKTVSGYGIIIDG